MKDTVPTSFRFRPEFSDTLKKGADELGISKTELIEKAVREYLSRSECATDSGTTEVDCSDGCTTKSTTAEGGRSDDVPWRELYYFERDKRAENEAALRDELTEIRKSLQAAQLMEGQRLSAAVEVEGEPTDKPMTRWQHFKAAFRRKG